MSGKLRNVFISGAAGRLEGLWKEATPPKRGSAVFAHPHPRHGGTMHNKVVYRAAQALTAAGWETLRFNFRGVGLSEGRYDEGRGEVEDLWAALEEAAASGGLPIVAGGFSFGAAVAWRAIQQDSRIAAFVGAGLPVGTPFCASLPRPALWVPSLFVVGENDTYGPPAKLREFLAHAENVQIVEIAGADHFFEGKLPELEAALYRFAKDSVPEVMTRASS